MSEAEVPLAGGNMNAAVVRARDLSLGDTVRRQASPQSATIQRLVAHVRERGVTWVPEPLGFDAEGREVWRYIEGEVAPSEADFRADAAIVTDVARALRQWHDATASFPRSSADVWVPHGDVPGGDTARKGVIAPDDTARNGVIAHNDFAPYNHVFRDGQFVGAIDFDVCYPATREWDLAWTLYRYVYLPALVPLAPAQGEPWPLLPSATAHQIADDCAAPAATFMGAYLGAEPVEVSTLDVLTTIRARLESMAAWCGEQASPAHRGWGLMYAAHARWMTAVRGQAER